MATVEVVGLKRALTWAGDKIVRDWIRGSIAELSRNGRVTLILRTLLGAAAPSRGARRPSS